MNLKCNEIFTKGLPKNLKDFANKRQVKHPSTVLEPSIPFHTLVKLVDAEDIANDKIRTHDLALEVNNITNQLHTQTLEPSSQEQRMFTQPKDPNNKNKPAYKKYCSYCHRTNHSISALLFSKNNEMMKTNEMHMLDLNLHKNHLYSTSVLLLMIEQDTMIINTEVEVPHVTTLTTIPIKQIDTVLHLEIELAMTKELLLHNTLDHDMILTDAIHGLTTLDTDLHIDLLIDTTLALDIDHAPIQETIILQNTQITSSQRPFQVIFNPVKGINTGTHYRTIHPQNITHSIQDVFLTYMRKHIEFNENQDTPLYGPSNLEDLTHKSEYFEVPDLETRIQRHDNPHYWLQQDILQVKNFQIL